MRVIGFDPSSPEEVRNPASRPFATVAEMLPKVDYLTVHTTLTPETKNLIGPKEVRMLKKGARLVNCASRRDLRRSRTGRRPQERTACRSGHGHLLRRAMHQKPLFGLPGRRLHAPPWRKHRQRPETTWPSRRPSC